VIKRAAADCRGHREGKRAVGLVAGVAGALSGIKVNVIVAARSNGLAGDDRGEASGTIDGDGVLASISELAATPTLETATLFADAARRVRLARSAVRLRVAAASALSPLHSGASVQPRALRDGGRSC
jgi:hypothetical protein